MIRLLAGVLLAQLNLILVIGAFVWVTGIHDARQQYARALTAETERDMILGKHEMLKRYIKREGLWKRLGMDQQPYLR